MPFLHRATPLLTLLALLAVPAAADAQRRDGKLSGSVVDKHTGLPIAGVTVVNLLDGKSMLTDSVGAYRFEKLPAGIVRFLFRVPGFPQQGLVIALAEREVMERRVELDSATIVAAPPPPGPVAPTQGVQQLSGVTVVATPSMGPRYANFERRRKTGAGQYLVREDIEKSGAANLQDAVRSLRGVQLDCGGGHGCSIRMARAPMRCPPEYVVDDVVNNSFGPSVAVRDIEALEVYTGQADVPGEYAGRNAGCGVIVIWTRAGPPRGKKR
ncbi:MAG: carboxypeptidase regulatory-like domain-containing protein [Gemmatimonadota bacterium]